MVKKAKRGPKKCRWCQAVKNFFAFGSKRSGEVKGYRRKDGTWVKGHVRKPKEAKPLKPKAKPPSEVAKVEAVLAKPISQSVSVTTTYDGELVNREA